MSICFLSRALPVPFIRNLIETAPELRGFADTVRRLLAIQSELRAGVPDTLKHAASVASIVNGRLLLLAPDAAAAGKLRHLLPRLLRAVQQHAPEVTAIDVRVQVTEVPKPLPLKRKMMTVEARNAFKTLAARLPPSSLQRAAQRIARLPLACSKHEQEPFENQKS